MVAGHSKELQSVVLPKWSRRPLANLVRCHSFPALFPSSALLPLVAGPHCVRCSFWMPSLDLDSYGDLWGSLSARSDLIPNVLCSFIANDTKVRR